MELQQLPKFDIVLACGVLHHLNDAHAEKVLSLAHAALKIEGRLVAVDPCIASGQDPIALFLVRHDRGRHVRGGWEHQKLAELLFQTVTGTLRHQKWIPNTHWIMECTK